MKSFKYLQPKTLKEASNLLQSNGNQVFPFAGGTDILGLVKDDIIAPDKIINLKRIPNLNRIEYTPGKGLRIGALVTISDIAENSLLREKYPILPQAASEIASPQLRNVGTLGGNLCQRPRCDYFREDFNCIRKGGDTCFAYSGHNKLHCVIGGGPCYIVHPSDMAVVLLALDASVEIFSEEKTRTIPLKNFLVLPDQNQLHENILKPGEILTEIQIPELPADSRSGYLKFKERAVWDFAVVSVAGVLQKNNSTIKSGRLAFGGVAPVPWEETNINQKLKSLAINENSFSQISKEMLKEADPLEMNAYKIPLARNLMKRLLTKLSA